MDAGILDLLGCFEWEVLFDGPNFVGFWDDWDGVLLECLLWGILEIGVFWSGFWGVGILWRMMYFFSMDFDGGFSAFGSYRSACSLGWVF